MLMRDRQKRLALSSNSGSRPPFEDLEMFGSGGVRMLSRKARSARKILIGVVVIGLCFVFFYRKLLEGLIKNVTPTWDEYDDRLDEEPGVVRIKPPSRPPAAGHTTTTTAGEKQMQEQQSLKGFTIRPLGSGLTREESSGADIAKRDAVVEAFKYAWDAYERDAWGFDEYHPLSHHGSDLQRDHPYGYTVVDSIDTLILMDLKNEYLRARDWVDKKLDFDIDGPYNVFETTIRVLGGLLSSYALSLDPLYLTRATDLGSRLLVSFDANPTGLPSAMVNLGKRGPVHNTGGEVSTAEVSTLQLEFRYLTKTGGNRTFWEKAEKVMEVLDKMEHYHGLAPITIDPITAHFKSSDIRLGSRGDSYYEYLLKQYLQTGKREKRYRGMYDRTVDGITDHLLTRTPNAHLLFTGELQPAGSGTWNPYPKQDHLVCFLGGSLLLGATDGGLVNVPPILEQMSERSVRDWKNGLEMIETCMETHNTATGLSPEIAHFKHGTETPDHKGRDWYITGGWDARYSLRPETVESLFIAYRLTHDPKYRDYGWKIFQAIEKHCKVPSGGYASVLDVDSTPVRLDDKMETFFLSETLKYLFLLFEDPSVVPLTEYVFNTEAHPLPIFDPGFRTAFM